MTSNEFRITFDSKLSCVCGQAFGPFHISQHVRTCPVFNRENPEVLAANKQQEVEEEKKKQEAEEALEKAAERKRKNAARAKAYRDRKKQQAEDEEDEEDEEGSYSKPKRNKKARKGKTPSKRGSRKSTCRSISTEFDKLEDCHQNLSYLFHQSLKQSKRPPYVITEAEEVQVLVGEETDSSATLKLQNQHCTALYEKD